MEIIKWVVIAVIIMLILFCIVFKICLCGVMNIDETNPDKDKYDLQLNHDPENLKKKLFIIFLVKRKKNNL